MATKINQITETDQVTSGDYFVIDQQNDNGFETKKLDFNNLSSRLNIPYNVSQLNNDSGYTTNIGTISSITVNAQKYETTDGNVDLTSVLDKTSADFWNSSYEKTKTFDKMQFSGKYKDGTDFSFYILSSAQ